MKTDCKESEAILSRRISSAAAVQKSHHGTAHSYDKVANSWDWLVTAGHSIPVGMNSFQIIPRRPKKTISLFLIFDFDIRAFFGRVDPCIVPF